MRAAVALVLLSGFVATPQAPQNTSQADSSSLLREGEALFAQQQWGGSASQV
jgi:hypothetical protein